jgi:hypothetical protein
MLFKARFLGITGLVLQAGLWPVAAEAATVPGLSLASSFAILSAVRR